MIHKPKWIQASVLVAGVLFNVIFAFLIFVFLFIRGVELNSNIVPFIDSPEGVRVDYIADDSISMKAGLTVGDVVTSVQVQGKDVYTDNQKIFEVLYSEYKEPTQINVITANQESKKINLVPVDATTKFGFSLTDQIYVKTNPFTAILYGAKATINLTKLTAVGLFDFFAKLFTGNANFKEVAGPVGIVGLVDKAAQNGFNHVLFLTAIISINLAVLNLLPFPALDGGRLVIVVIEAIMRKDLNYKKVALVNTVGFFLLITLMIILTFHDVKNLFN
jgi:regulator of sigma E protease